MHFVIDGKDHDDIFILVQTSQSVFTQTWKVQPITGLQYSAILWAWLHPQSENHTALS